MTSQAFGSVFSWFPYLLVIAIFLFAFLYYDFMVLLWTKIVDILIW